MKSNYRSKSLWTLCGLFTLSAALVAQPQQAAADKPAIPPVDRASDVKVADLAFLTGRWQGTVNNNTVNQLCTITEPAMMLCMFWLNGAQGTEMIELYTIRDTPTGVEERVRFLSPELNEEPGDKGLTMKLASYSPSQVVFANPNGTYPRRSTLTRIGDDQFTSRIELVDEKGKESFIEAHWRKLQ